MHDDARAVAESLTACADEEKTAKTAPLSASSSRMRRNLARFARYASFGDDVKGFFEPGLLRLYLTLDALHETRGVEGALAEVGVYHGKSFIPLALLRRDEGSHRELCLAIDCFHSQEFNRDQSGEGDRAAFQRNVEAAMRACCSGEGDGDGSINAGGGGSDGGVWGDGWLRVMEADSVTLSPSAVSAAIDAQPVRLFSIDGSHTAEATAADLSTASATLHPEGAVIVDDAFNADWPGVMTGVFQWYYSFGAGGERGCTDDRADTNTADGSSVGSSAELVPFAVGFNKVVFCRPEMHAEYYAHVGGGDASPRVRKTASFMGHQVAVFSHGWIATFHGNE